MTVFKINYFSRLMLPCARSQILNTSSFHIKPCRHISVGGHKNTKVLKTEKEKLRTYVVQRYMNYVKNYTTLLETKFPTVMNMYRVFTVGMKDFLKDLKTYISLRVKLSKDKGFSKLSRQEIELYQKMPSDMLRITPVLILSAVPFGNYIVFPLAFIKPRMLLCSHFWSIQQRAEFNTQDLKERLHFNKPVFRDMQEKIDLIPDSETKIKWEKIVAMLGSGVQPTIKEILECKQLFCSGPYQLKSLSFKHAGHILKMHGIRRGIFRRKKLRYRALLLTEIDKAIIREGGVEKLSTECLRNACHIRGLNSSHLNNAEMKAWLSQWLAVSKHIDKSSYSLLLHCPILLSYNHPQNWVLIY